jgi:hypothetical protein
MAAQSKVTTSVTPSKHTLTAAERRAAQLAAGATRQAELKSEAAERRARRAQAAR